MYEAPATEDQVEGQDIISMNVGTPMQTLQYYDLHFGTPKKAPMFWETFRSLGEQPPALTSFLNFPFRALRISPRNVGYLFGGPLDLAYGILGSRFMETTLPAPSVLRAVLLF